MNATVTTTCNAINWIVAHSQFTGSEEVHPDIAKNGETVIHNWAFVGTISERMVRDIQAFITVSKQTQKTYGNRAVVSGYEIDCSRMADANSARVGRVSHICISKAE